MRKIAFIGFGELGQRFSRDLLVNDGLAISAYDIVFDDLARSQASTASARHVGVTPAQNAADACKGAEIVFSAVTANQAEAVARAVASYLEPGQILLDVNSASPGTKRRAAGYLTTSGAEYVEGAVMGPVLKPGIRVPILTAGPAAERASEILNALGMNLTPVAREHGRASAIKLCRSIVIKGLEALMVDCAQAAKAWDVAGDVFGSLGETFPSIDWEKLATDMGERVATHGVRRAAEMREAAQMLGDLGLDPSLTSTVADAQERGARAKRAAEALPA
jgi:3-hydroxyisobutyrate dehydrogenase-like beta-hydroxyacid dehydrogenase